ncbi:MAG: Ig-like domain-containing protein [Candidatus Brocadia sp.]|uniref:LamG-like jellyroll fold domain-containing protein n=1 Tax=Candidatus Brocadia fulgida TaxID=380242 RepID=A0A0M2UWW8_9BACT|nr:MAG: hypothetical protein BROFUL_00934 [Candidatus Brocadia fulgida]UJS21528.1 MAG: Ig-like domain-containing protein [Candidatus Brocadia sp.]
MAVPQKFITVLMATSMMFMYATSVLASLNDGLVASYPFNSNAQDESGNGNHGTVQGATLTNDRYGNANSAYSFDGIDDHILIPDNNSLDLSNSLTITAWIKSLDTSGPRAIVSKWNDDTRDWAYLFKDHNDSDKLRIELSQGNHHDLADLEGTTSIVPDQWIHVAVTYDSNFVKLYFNGAEDASLSRTGIMNNSAENLLIGAVYSRNISEYFHGVIDEVRIYNRALSESEIHELYSPDTTPPTVSSTNPTGNATEIDVTGVITAMFSEAMNAATINTNTFTVRDNNLNSAITGTVSYSGTTATFTPTSPLIYSTTYTATLTTGITDLAGNAISSDFTWNFTTRPLPVRYASSGMTVDGNLSESGWDVGIDAAKVVNGVTNNTAQFGVLWDTTYLYVGMRVLDNNLSNDSATVWHDDSIEVSIDGDYNHSTTYDSHDRRFNKGWNDASLYERSGNTTGVLHGWASVPGGYTIELAIPWGNLGITPAEGMTLGLSAGYSDDDNGGNREGKVIWIGNADTHSNPSSLGHIVLADSIAHYAFSEGAGTTAGDSSVYDKDGTISGAAWTTGKEGGGLGFNGTSDYVTIPLMSSDEMSLSAWFYKHANDVSYTDAIVGGFRNDANLQLQEGFEVRFSPASPNSLDFVLITRDGSGVRTSRTARRNLLNAAGSWYHVGCSYNKATGQQRLYVNGQLIRTVTHPAGNSIVPMTYYPGMTIGHSAATTGYFYGVIDDVRLYDRVLSDREMQGLYNAFTSALQARYALDENTGTVANDSSGNGNHGSVNGGATWTTGRYGGGLGFDGANDYVSIPRSNHDELSVCAWFYKNANDTARNDAIFSGFRNNSNAQLMEGFELRFPSGASSNTLQFVLTTQNGSGVRTMRTTQMNLGNSVGIWYHAAGTYNKATGEQKLYVNGQLVNTQTHPVGNTVVPLAAYTDMRIGHSRVRAGYFNGTIDDVRIYNRALSDQEALDVYHNF